MKDFEWKFLEIIRKKIRLLGQTYLETVPLLVISGMSRWHEKTWSVVYTSFKVSISWPFSFSTHADLALYREGSYIQRHSDLSESLLGKEWRVVVILRNADKGGELLSDKFVLNWPRIKIINTRVLHEVTKVEKGTRLVLLIGVYFAPFNNHKQTP